MVRVITGLKISESRVSCEKLKKTQILSAAEGTHSRLWGRAGGNQKPKCFFVVVFFGGMVFIYTWNTKARHLDDDR